MTRHFALVPAAGGGSRMGAAVPKQYLPLLGRPLILHTLERLLAVPALDAVHVVLAPHDGWWDQLALPETGGRLVVHRLGGATRALSVRAGLAALAARPEDRVLVHDAARPCVPVSLVEALLAEAHPEGALLAVPVADTLKRADAADQVAATVPRDGLWAAQTPQIFPAGLLEAALAAPGAAACTDEAQAVEALGLRPQLVRSSALNLKVTYPADIALAELILSSTRGAFQCA